MTDHETPTGLSEAEWEDIRSATPDVDPATEGWEWHVLYRSVERILTARLAAQAAAHAEEVAGLRAELERWIGQYDRMRDERDAERDEWGANRARAESAKADVEEVAGRLSGLLCELTDGLMSKTDYSVRTMVQAVEAVFEKHAIVDMDELRAERDDLRAKVAGVEALFAGGPDTPCRTTWRREDALWGDEGRTECVEVPMDDLRAALTDAAGSGA